MGDLISRKAAIAAFKPYALYDSNRTNAEWVMRIEAVLEELPSAEKEPEKTVHIPETKAIPSARSCVDLAEKVTAMYYDEEHEEWARRKVTIADILDSVCDDYTILPSAEKRGKWSPCIVARNIDALECSECGAKYPNIMWMPGYNYCPNCGALMEEQK